MLASRPTLVMHEPLATRKPKVFLDLSMVNSWSTPPLEAEAAAAQEILEQRPLSQLRVVTWNIWFDSLASQHRLNALLKELLHVAPDVACLQEVLPGVADAIRASVPLSTVYDISWCDVGRYGNMTLVRKDLKATFALLPMPTGMGRKLLLAQCHARLPGLHVANVHLESLDNEEIRRQQLEMARKVLGHNAHVMLCGDFNFDSTQTYGDWKRPCPRETLENCVLSHVFPEFVDAWPVVRDDDGFTFDGVLNPVCVSDPRERMRYDRVLARVGEPGLQPVHAALLGTSDINDWGVRPSDHFGLHVDFSINH